MLVENQVCIKFNINSVFENDCMEISYKGNEKKGILEIENPTCDFGSRIKGNIINYNNEHIVSKFNLEKLFISEFECFNDYDDIEEMSCILLDLLKSIKINYKIVKMGKFNVGRKKWY